MPERPRRYPVGPLFALNGLGKQGTRTEKLVSFGKIAKAKPAMQENYPETTGGLMTYEELRKELSEVASSQEFGYTGISLNPDDADYIDANSCANIFVHFPDGCEKYLVQTFDFIGRCLQSERVLKHEILTFGMPLLLVSSISANSIAEL